MRVGAEWLVIGAAGAVVLMLALDEQFAADAEGLVTDITEGAAQAVESVTSFKISRMSTVNRALVNHPNMRAMFAVIRQGEGTSDAGGYSRLFGGGQFQGFADHPRVVVKRGGYTSSAAGAYQALAKVWDETKRLMQLPDFSPASQDLFALGRIAARGAVDDVIAGRFDAAVKKLGNEWASLPGSPYGQPTKTIAQARSAYVANGGAFA